MKNALAAGGRQRFLCFFFHFSGLPIPLLFSNAWSGVVPRFNKLLTVCGLVPPSLTESVFLSEPLRAPGVANIEEGGSSAPAAITAGRRGFGVPQVGAWDPWGVRCSHEPRRVPRDADGPRG